MRPAVPTELDPLSDDTVWVLRAHRPRYRRPPTTHVHAPRGPEALWSWCIVGAAVAFLLLQLRPGLILANTTPTGGDLGAHVWGPDFLRRSVLPRLSWWAPDWFAGFPAYRFYMVVPAFAVVVLDLLLPYGVALKLVAVSGVIALPFAAYAFGRLTRLPFPVPALLSVASVLYLFDTRWSIYGGNIASMLAGEFSFSIALAACILYLGLLHEALTNGRRRGAAALALGVALLCHLIVAFFCLAATVVMIALYPSRRSLRRTGPIIGTGLLLAAFWLLPFWWDRLYVTDMGWTKLTDYGAQLFPGGLRFLVFGLALAGAVGAFVRRERGGMFLAISAVICALAFVFLPEWRLWNARILPFWFLCCYFLAALGAVQLLRWIGQIASGSPEHAPMRSGATVLTVVAVIAVGIPLKALPGSGTDPLTGDATWMGIDARPSYLPSFLRNDFNGYQRAGAWPEYRSLMATMRAVGAEYGCGRTHWQYEAEQGRFGTTLALMLLPFWSNGCIQSMEGLYFESSATTPYHFMTAAELSPKASRPMQGVPFRGPDLALGVEHLQALGVRYFMAFSPDVVDAARQNPALTEIATSAPDWSVFLVANSDIVTGLDVQPVVVPGIDRDNERWQDVGTASFNLPVEQRVPLAASGPDDWPRVSTPAEAPHTPIAPVGVSNLVVGSDRVSFDVDEPGRPVLVKISAFPNWSVSGAKGPYRVTPNQMVVIPTGRHVVLEYGTSTLDVVALLLSVIGIGALALLVRSDRRTRTASRAAAATPAAPPV